MPLEFDKLFALGTDSAAFLFFDPDTLTHRVDDDVGWWYEDFKQEFTFGKLAAFITGKDGQFTLKFVKRHLTSIEKRVLVSKADFRLEVTRGRFYWDNGEAIPCDFQALDANEEDKEGWLHLANGKYKLTVHALDWFSVSEDEREAQVDPSHFIVRLQALEDFEGIPVPTSIPWLMPSKKWHEKRLEKLQSL